MHVRQTTRATLPHAYLVKRTMHVLQQHVPCLQVPMHHPLAVQVRHASRSLQQPAEQLDQSNVVDQLQAACGDSILQRTSSAQLEHQPNLQQQQQQQQQRQGQQQQPRRDGRLDAIQYSRLIDDQLNHSRRGAAATVHMQCVTIPL
jgi:hypothetical protein